MTDTARPTAPSSNGRGHDGDRAGGDPGETPTRRLLRIVATTAVLVLAAGIFAYSCSKGETTLGVTDNPAIVAQFPAPGGRALRQTDVGAELLVGYDGLDEERVWAKLRGDDDVTLGRRSLHGSRNPR
mgnify:CR=1 FL=1